MSEPKLRVWESEATLAVIKDRSLTRAQMASRLGVAVVTVGYYLTEARAAGYHIPEKKGGKPVVDDEQIVVDWKAQTIKIRRTSVSIPAVLRAIAKASPHKK